MKKYLFFLILPLIFFIPTNVFASQNYYTNYHADLQNNNNDLQVVKTGYYGLQLFDYEYYFYYKVPKNPYPGLDKLDKLVISVYSDIADGMENFGSNQTSYLQFINSGLTVRLLSTVNDSLTGSYCNFTENTGNFYLLTCPIPTGATEIRGFRVQYDDIELGNTLIVAPKIGFSRDVNYYGKDNSSSQIIENNNQNTQDIINSNKETQDKIDETNETLQQTNDYLTSDEVPESDVSALGNVQGLLPPGPVDSLLNIPFKFLSIIVSSLGDLCVPLSMDWVFNQTLTLPCFSDSFYDNVPSGLMVFINLIPTGFILILYLKHLYKKVNRAVSMETTSDDEWGVL